jgi:methionyl-tRNA formyltransferase
MAAPRLVFMGTPEIARVSLAALLDRREFEVVAVVSQPDRAKGRNLAVQPPPAKELALERQLPVLQPEKARDPAFLAQLHALAPDCIVVVAYGHILPQAILDLPRRGCVNVHTSLLPKYRGAAPIQWAIAHGDELTGVTLMRMDAGMDTGPILATRETQITRDDTGQTLHDRLARLGAELLIESLPGILAGSVVPQPQPLEGASLAPKIRKEDGQLDWQLPATTLWNRLRAFTPWPGAFTHLRVSNRQMLLKICRAEPQPGTCGQPGEVLAADAAGVVIGCGQGSLRVLELQLEGGKRLTARAFLAGHLLAPGTRLT